MTYDFLEGCRAKVERASCRLQELEENVDSAATQNLFGVTTESAPDNDEYILKALLPRDLFLGYSVSAGEIIHQLRSSLDHLLWQLVIANGARPDRFTGFPVAYKKAIYKRQGRKIAGISGAAATLIEELQPFRSDDYASHPLYTLTELWNQDKHRLLLLTITNLVAYNVNYHYPSGRVERVYIDIDSSSIADGVAIGRFRDPDDFGEGVRKSEMFASSSICSSVSSGITPLYTLAISPSAVMKYVLGMVKSL